MTGKGISHRMTKRSITTRGLPLAALLLLGGCLGGLGGKVPPQLISLTAADPAPAGPLGGGSAGSGLIVLDPETDRRIDVQRVPVQVSPSTVAYLKDAMWVEKPARQFRRLLAETIRAKSGRLVLEGGEAEAVGRDMLAGRLVDLGYDAASQSVVVRYDAIRNDGKGAVSVRRFESIVPGVSPKAETVGPALNRAANDVARQVAAWIG
jgi:cholesterol transport system auxiliary component